MESKHGYKRVLLKISGESLVGSQGFGIDQEACGRVAKSIFLISQAKIEVAIVIGGGNIYRGVRLNQMGIERTRADQMGMIATLMNGIALQQALLAMGSKAKLMSALECPQVAENYHWEKAKNYLSEGYPVIFVGGTGHPYFTTDTAAALRASEMNVDVLLKATKVDGIYNKDPLIYSNAVKYSEITYSQMLAEKLEAMDATAIALCRSNRIPILVFNMQLLFNTCDIQEIWSHDHQGTLVKGN